MPTDPHPGTLKPLDQPAMTHGSAVKVAISPISVRLSVVRGEALPHNARPFRGYR